MENQNIIINANKYHADTGFQVEPDYSPKAIKLSLPTTGRMFNALFVPKSACNLIKTKAAGEYEIHIERWFCELPANKEFFKSKL